MLSVFNDDFLKFSSGNNLFYTQQDHYIHFPLVVTVCGSKIWFSWTLFVRPLSNTYRPDCKQVTLGERQTSASKLQNQYLYLH